MTISTTSSHDHDGATHSDGAKIIETTLEHPIQIHLWEDRTRGSSGSRPLILRGSSCWPTTIFASPGIMRSIMGSARSSLKRSSQEPIGYCLRNAWGGNSPPKIGASLM